MLVFLARPFSPGALNPEDTEEMCGQPLRDSSIWTHHMDLLMITGQGSLSRTRRSVTERRPVATFAAPLIMIRSLMHKLRRLRLRGRVIFDLQTCRDLLFNLHLFEKHMQWCVSPTVCVCVCVAVIETCYTPLWRPGSPHVRVSLSSFAALITPGWQPERRRSTLASIISDSVNPTAAQRHSCYPAHFAGCQQNVQRKDNSSC